MTTNEPPSSACTPLPEASDPVAGRCAVATGSPLFIIDEILKGYNASRDRVTQKYMCAIEPLRSYYAGKVDTLEFAIDQTKLIRVEVERATLENTAYEPTRQKTTGSK